MTNIPTLRAVLSRVESLKGPLTRGEAEKIADKLFMLSQDRVEWLDVVAALGGGRSALGAVCALIEREHGTGVPIRMHIAAHWCKAFVGWGLNPKGECKRPDRQIALAVLWSYLQALIAEAEQAGQRAGKAS